jgi:hypothetical protein
MKLLKKLLPLVALFFVSNCLLAEEPSGQTPSDEADDRPTSDVTDALLPGASPDRPRTMSGMSILGNEEAPKSLVIVPWKSSRLGDEPGLTGALDERARPVDREVFMRELRYYEIRSGR